MKVRPIIEEATLREEGSSIKNNLLKNSKNGGGYISLPVFIMFTISSLILIGCLLVWLTSFLVTSNSIDTLNTMFIDESAHKITRTLEGFLGPVGKVSRMMAREWNKGVVTIDIMKDYLYPKIAEFGFTSCGFFFNDTYSYRYAYAIQGTVSNMYWVYAKQNYGDLISTRDKVNITTGEITIPGYVKLIPQVVNTYDYWIFMEKYYNTTGLEGGFGDPSFAAGSGMALTYTQWVYDQAMWKNQTRKRFIGLAKVNLSLDYIVKYLSSNIQLLGNGYVVVTLNSGIVIGGSINTTIDDGQSVANIFNIETRGAGKTIKKFYEMNGHTFLTLPTSMYVTSEGVNYLISPFKFRFENLEWNIFFVLYESDVSAAMVLSSSISVGVTVAVILIGIVASLFTSWIVSKPMKFLERQFSFIRVMNLDCVDMTRKSIFKEVHSIYGNLNETVTWLNEIKAFIPDNVFDQIRQDEQNSTENQKKQQEIDPRQSKVSSMFHSAEIRNSTALSGNGGSSKKGSFSTPSLFKTGFSKKGCVVIHVKLEGLADQGADYVSNFFQKFVAVIGPVIKVNQATMQLISCEEIQFSITSKFVEFKLLEKAFDCCKKIVKSVERPIIPRIGICCGIAHVGNIGTKTSRYYSVLGDVPDCARIYSNLAEKYNVNMISDDWNLPLDLFITRPLDRIQVKSNAIHTIYEILDKKNKENDEWLYELENNKNNDKYKDYLSVFNLFTANYHNNSSNLYSDIENALSILNHYKQNNLDESDLSYLNLSTLFFEVNELPDREAISRINSYSRKLVLDLK